MSAINEIKADVEARMEKTIDALKRNFSGLRTGRASTSFT